MTDPASVESVPSADRSMRRLVAWILDHRAMVLLTIGCITAAAAWILATRAAFGSSIGKLFFAESPRYARYLDYSRELGTDEALIIGLEAVDILAPDTLDRLERAVARVSALSVDEASAPGSDESSAPGESSPPDATSGHTDFDDFDDFDDDFDEGEVASESGGIVRRVQSVLSARRVRRRGDILSTQSYADLARSQPDGRAALRQELIDDELASGALISQDGQHAAVIIELIADKNRPAEAVSVVVNDAITIFRDEGFSAEQIHRAGPPAVMSEMFRLTKENVLVIFPITAVILTITVLILFRQLWPPVLAAFASGIGVIWTMGVSVLIDPQISIMHSIAPMVMLIVASSDVIHLCSAYMLELGQGKSRHEAILDSTAEVGRACLFTSMTTFVGFIGLSFVPTPVFRQLGIILGCGVAFALLLAVTIVPIALSWLPAPAGWQSQRGTRVQQALDNALTWLMEISVRRPYAVVAAYVAIAILTAVGLSQLHIETALVERFDDDNVVAMDREWFREHFASTNVVQVVIDTGRAGGVKDLEFLQKLAALESEIEADPKVDAVYGVVDLLSMLHAQLSGEPRGLPSHPNTPAEYFFVLESRDQATLRGLTDFELRRAILSVRLEEEGVRAGFDAGQAIEERAQELLGDAVTIESTGMQYMTGEWLGSIVAGQQRGLGVTFVVILVMMIIALRSLRAGVWSMVPNALPLLMLGGWLGLTKDSVDSDTLVLAMLAIGIGVDDTIHFLMRYRLEFQRDGNREAALHRTYHYAGRAIVITTVVLTLGFAPFMMSAYYSVAMLGTLLPLTLIFALLADLLLVPALASLGWLRFTAKSTVR
ncbi:MAG: MMPL family transporter [Myxococcota bacterium]|nr:MMPL family transporter [Myxococcota bacterium]